MEQQIGKSRVRVLKHQDMSDRKSSSLTVDLLPACGVLTANIEAVAVAEVLRLRPTFVSRIQPVRSSS